LLKLSIPDGNGDVGIRKGTIAGISTSELGDTNGIHGKNISRWTSWNKTKNKLDAICKGYTGIFLFFDVTGIFESKNMSPSTPGCDYPDEWQMGKG
jgi:hypothetical protein